MSAINKNIDKNLLSPEINQSELDIKISSFKYFFTEQIFKVLENKPRTILFAGALATSLSMVNDISKNSSEDQGINNIQTQSFPIMKKSHIFEKINQDEIKNTLGYVDIENKTYHLNHELIQEQADYYSLDLNIFQGVVLQNEFIGNKLTQIFPESNFDALNQSYSYRQIFEALQEYYVLMYLIDQQGSNGENKIAAQRIFNELLRSKQLVTYQGSTEVIVSDKYDLIHSAAEYNYEYVLGKQYTQESMKDVTHSIDADEYDIDILTTYTEEFKSYINTETGGLLDQYIVELSTSIEPTLLANN